MLDIAHFSFATRCRSTPVRRLCRSTGELANGALNAVEGLAHILAGVRCAHPWWPTTTLRAATAWLGARPAVERTIAYVSGVEHVREVAKHHSQAKQYRWR
jgi:hypothetical protein